MREVYENKELVGGKYHWLAENDISSTEWKILKPEFEFYLFQPQNINLKSEYENAPKITDILLINSLGVATARDNLTIQFTQNKLWETINKFIELLPEDARSYFDLDKDARDWSINLAQKDIKNSGLSKSQVFPIMYRPFDQRFTYYTGNSRGFHCMPRSEVMNHIIKGENLALATLRRPRNEIVDNFFVSDKITDKCIISSLDNANIFPLYLYPTNTPTLFDSPPTNAPGGRKPNLSPEFITGFSQKLDLEFIFDGKGDKTKTFGPEDIFNYIYAVFHSPNYRQRYAEFLKIDFPRVPLTANSALFWELVIKGDKLVKYHLMKETGTEISTYPIPGSDMVEQVKYNENHQQIWINAEQYFDQVPPQIWNFYIGGYQVCQKWLKDRKGRELNFDDISHYQNIISIISETMKMMEDVDRIIEKYGGFPLQ